MEGKNSGLKDIAAHFYDFVGNSAEKHEYFIQLIVRIY